MNQDIKKEWIKALRSGKYKQTTAALKNKQGLCCLGVLCEIFSEEKDIPWSWEDEENDDASFIYETGILPVEVLDWAGLPREVPVGNFTHCNNQVIIPGRIHPDTGVEQISLTMLNDGCAGQSKHNFNEIADIIEKEL